MANEEQLNLLKRDKHAWNQWKKSIPGIRVDLSRADLNHANLSGADLSEADLNQANLSCADLRRADLSYAYLAEANLFGTRLNQANLRGAYLSWANLSHADLHEAILSFATLSFANLCGAYLRGAYLISVDLSEADLSEADLSGADFNAAYLSKANLSKANLSKAILVDTNLKKATLTNCLIYGISVWNVQLEETEQLSLVITHPDQTTITVDNLEVAQFIYLLLNNEKIREVIDTITSKVVLILGRFTPERKAILDALRDELRKHNYTPVLFDFEKPASRDLTETVSILAHLARFIIVDLTDPRSAPHEVATVIPHTVVPVQPLLLHEPLVVNGQAAERREYALFEDLRRRYHWVLPTLHYQDTAELLASLQTQIITAAEQKVQELTRSQRRIVLSENHTMGL